MALTDKDIEQIEEYLLGNLTQEKAKQVEERTKNDSEFAEEVDFMRDVILATQEKGKEELEKILGEDKNEVAPEPEKRTEEKIKKGTDSGKNILSLRKNWMYYAVALTILLAFTIYLLLA